MLQKLLIPGYLEIPLETHKLDYCAVVLLDMRTCHNNVSKQCPCVQIRKWASDGCRNGGHPTDIDRASDKTGTDRTTAVGSHQECCCIPVNDTYVQIKPNKLAYKGVKSCVSTKEFSREEMSVCLALRAT